MRKISKRDRLFFWNQKCKKLKLVIIAKEKALSNFGIVQEKFNGRKSAHFVREWEQLLNLLRLKKDDNNIRPIEKILIPIAHDFDFNQFTVEN